MLPVDFASRKVGVAKLVCLEKYASSTTAISGLGDSTSITFCS